ncbi:MAG: DUF2914 domain-containing protein [Deltaproteobacteria bacterium]|nr:DUF2914 domain-containing protein [Deltaproteobacteria bacterium]
MRYARGVDANTPVAADAAVAAPAAPTGLRARLDAFRAKHKQLEGALFFVGGFCFDLLLLERIDSRPMLIHQGSYLVLLSILLAVDHHYSQAHVEKKGLWGKALHYRHELIHFLFGTLLNAFLVFYFKASSGVFAFGFLCLLGALLLANESPRFRELGPLMRVALYSFALTSYFSYLYPVIAGYLSPWLFVAAVGTASAVTIVLWFVYQRFTPDESWNFKNALAPALVIQGLLLALYFMHVVPPVPLSVKWMGVYHGVEREGRESRLLHEAPRWKFWAHGDTDFKARPGDRVWAFVRVFAPRNFDDGIKIRWFRDDPKKGWVGTDAIPLRIVGGGEEGWRGEAYKDHYVPGDWRVEIETNDGRTIGELDFTITADDSTAPREFRKDLR